MGLASDGSKRRFQEILMADQRAAMDDYDIAYEAVVKVLGTYSPRIKPGITPPSVREKWVTEFPELNDIDKSYLYWLISVAQQVSSLQKKPDRSALIRVLIEMVKTSTS